MYDTARNAATGGYGDRDDDRGELGVGDDGSERHFLRAIFRFSLRVSWSFNELIRCLIAKRVSNVDLPTPSVSIAACL